LSSIGFNFAKLLVSSTGIETENRRNPGRSLGFAFFTLFLDSFDPGLRPLENLRLLFTNRTDYTPQKRSATGLLIPHLRQSKVFAYSSPKHQKDWLVSKPASR
jgi:hypothetical protein